VIRASKLIIRPGEEVANASILVQDGRILRIGQEMAVPEGATEVKGEVVCASFIDPWSALGVDSQVLADRGLVPASRAVDGLDLYSSDHLREEALEAGVTSIRLQGGWQGSIGGLGAVLRLDPAVDDPGAAAMLADASLGMSVGLSIAQGSSFRQRPDGSFVMESGDRPVDVFDRLSAIDRVVTSIESGRSYRQAHVEYRYELEEWEKAIAESAEKLEKDFKKAKKKRDKEKKEAEEKGKEFKEEKYKEDKKPKQPKFDANKDVLARVAMGEIPLVVEVHRAGEIRNLLAGIEKLGRVRLIIAGGTEALSAADDLAKRHIPVIVWPSLRGTSAKDEFSGHDLSQAAELAEAGVTVLLGSGGRDATATRDLPLLASVAIGHGLDREAAFNALTLGAARAFDVSDRVGSVEVGKDADLLVLDGLPLETNTRVQYVFCGGRLVITPEN